LRESDDETDVEARLGAVVPRANLPEEPALAALPADPIAPKELAAPPIERDGVDAPLDAHAQERFARADLPDVSVVEDDTARSRPAPDTRPKRPV
jgi:hypothetical protein